LTAPKAFVKGGKIDPTSVLEYFSSFNVKKTVEEKDKGDYYIPAGAV
jgi:hypothetical protein